MAIASALGACCTARTLGVHGKNFGPDGLLDTASTSEYFWVYLQVVVRLSVRYLEVSPQGLRYTQSDFVLEFGFVS